MPKAVVIKEDDGGDAKVREAAVPEVGHGDPRGDAGIRDGVLPDVPAVPRTEQQLGQETGAAPDPGKTPGRAGASVEGPYKNLFYIDVNWETIAIKDGYLAIEALQREWERGQIRLGERISEDQKVNLHCANPDCLRPMASIRAAVSSWAVRDPAGVMRTLYACSDRCHAIIHRFQQGERVIKT
jgi:hypothetical protein